MRLIITGLPILLALAPATAMADTNRALGIPITPLTNTVQGTPADVTDGIFGEAWWSYQDGYYNTCSFTIDLGAAYSISSVVIGQYQLYGYALYSSTDGSTWTLQHHEDFGDNLSQTKTFTEGGAYVARYFKYTSYANWIQYIGVNEFQVFGNPAAPSAPPAPVPALSGWALALLALLLIAISAGMLRRRRLIGN
jgi:hypothetical protein